LLYQLSYITALVVVCLSNVGAKVGECLTFCNGFKKKNKKIENKLQCC